MSRFINLEFGGEAREQTRGPAPGAARDEAHYLGEAQRAWEEADFQRALRAFAKVLEFNPHNAAAWTAQVRMLLELDLCGEANGWADQALERFPTEAALLAAKAVVLGREGECHSALAFSDAAVGQDGACPYVWLARGDVLLSCGEGLADYCFDKALMLGAHDWFTAWQGARIRMHHGQFPLALRLLQKAVEWNPAHFLPWLELGRCQEAVGLAEAAEKSLTHARDLNRNQQDAAEALTRLAARGTCEKVRGWLRRLKL